MIVQNDILSLKVFEGVSHKSSQRNSQNHLSYPSLSHKEQECQESLIQGKIHIQQKIGTKTSNVCKAKF